VAWLAKGVLVCLCTAVLPGSHECALSLVMEAVNGAFLYLRAKSADYLEQPACRNLLTGLFNV
jgi:hypothetical protein